MLTLIRRYSRTFLVILLLGLLFRFSYNTHIGWDHRLIGDEHRYYGVAANLAQGHGYTFNGEQFTLIPGTSLILAFFFLIFGASPLLGKIIVSASSAFIAPLTFLVAMKLHKKYWPAVLAGVWMAFYPYFLHEATMMDSENFFIPLFLIFIFYWFDLNSKKLSLPYFFVGGAFLGALTLIRPVGYYLAFFLVGWFIVFCDKPFQYLKEKWKSAAVFLVAFFLVLSPWIIRNELVFHKYIPTNTDFLEILCASNNEVTFTDPVVAGNYLGLYNVIGTEVYDRMSDAQRKAYFIEVNKKYWYKLPWLTVMKLKWFWHYSPMHPYHRNLLQDVVGMLTYGIFIPFFIWGFWRHRKERPYQYLLWLIVYFCVSTMASYGCTRLRLPLDPLLIAVAFLAVWEVLPKKIQKKLK